MDGSDQFERRVRLMALIGILLTSFVIGGLATVLSYRYQADKLNDQLFFAIQLQTSAMDAELGRLSNIASQVTSRTRIRQEFERYNSSEISRQQLIEFTVPKLSDAMLSISDLLGITRLSPQMQPVIEVGAPIPRGLWPEQISRSDIVIGIPSDGMIVISAPILNHSSQLVGIDLVMFRDHRLQAIVQGFFDRIDAAGSVQAASLLGDRVVHFYDFGHTELSLSDEGLRNEFAEQMRLGVDEGLHAPDISGPNDLILMHRAIGESDWVFIFYADPSEFFAPARMQAAYVALSVLVLTLLGIALTGRVVQPLVRKISTETRSLQLLLKRNEELLDAVQANEAKLQAVIDNAPAVIYIKDRTGRYLLVNSSYERLVDRPREQIIGRFDHELFPEDIAKSTHDTDLEVLATGRSLALDEKAPHADGMHDYLSTKFPLLDSKGGVDGVCGIATDISERKQVERRLALTQTTVDRANVGVYWADAEGRLLYINDTACELLKLSQAQALNTQLTDITDSFDQVDWQTHWQITRQSGSLHYETVYRRGDGSSFPAEVYANHLAYEEQAFYIALVHDISARRESERKLRQSATVFDCTAEAILITDAQGVVLDINNAFSELLGYTREELIGRTPSLWKSNVHNRAFYKNMWRSVTEDGEWRGEIINRRKDGAIIPALAAISTVRNESGERISYVAIYTDISQIKDSQRQLAHLAHHDALTDLPNRIMFNERLRHSLDRASRRDGRVAVIFVDLDHFKHVNDSLGHSYGDRLLIDVAQLLTSLVRNDDTVARIGGDEFTILIEEVGDRGMLASVIEKIIEAFNREFHLGESTVRVTPSLGVSVSPDHGEDAETLMRNADAAMYRAKAMGRNTYQFYTEELTKLAFERMRMDSALRQAIPKGEFSLCYQPQIELENGQLVGMEALVRWHNAELGQVPPDQFIPIAEDTGLILPLGEWIL
ncbi:MAG: diguanylate cyclase, partial [Sedimenticolaceae bacterium]